MSLARCADRLASLVHPAVARLVDFGVAGAGEWVEAWDVDEHHTGVLRRWPPEKLARLWCRADRALRIVGCRLARRSEADVGVRAGAPVLVPVPGAAVCELAEPDSRGELDLPSPDLAITWRAHEEYHGLVDLLEATGGAGPRTVVVRAPEGSGVTTLFAMVAMAARRCGWVPVTDRIIDAPTSDPDRGPLIAALLHARHVLILQDLRGAEPALRATQRDGVARFVAGLDARLSRPHLVLAAVATHVDADVALAPWPSERLLGVAHNLGLPAAEWAECCGRALRRAGGWPGTFVRALTIGAGVTREVAYSRSEDHGLEVRDGQSAVAEPPSDRADPGVARACEQVRAGLSQVERGRHAAGARTLKGALCAMARRGADFEAGRTALALARVFWRRGLLERARETLTRAHEHSTRARDTGGIIAGLVLQGWVAMHDDRLAEAESILLTARAASEHAAYLRDLAAAVVALALCYRWQDRWADAARAVGGLPPAPETGVCPADGVAEASVDTLPSPPPRAEDGNAQVLPVGCPYAVAGALRALVACGLGDLGAAARTLHAIRRGDGGSGPNGQGWFVDAVALRVHGALGDAEAIHRTLAHGLASARRSHEPLGALEVRVAHAEALFDAGETRAMTAALGRLGRWRRTRIPALHARRIDRLERGRAQPAMPSRRTEPPLAHPQALRVLAACHEASDERELVDRVCESVRKTLGAHAVAIVGAAERIPQELGRAGATNSGPRHAMLTRVFDLDLLIGPERTALGIEAACPIHYGGAMIGAVHVRWTATGRPDPSSVRAVVTTAALAVAPAVRGLLDARGAPAQEMGPQDELVGHSDAIDKIREQVRRAAAAPFPVLVQGESGTGKELVARALHRASPRRGRRFCAINCAAVGDELFEAELFGHVRGAFTGAVAERIGLFEEADGGTLLLDEVGELSARAQAKLLRTIQEGEIRRIGENVDRRVDVRIVAATNRQLADEARDGRFRQDLLFRLDVVRITMPPLRERPDDVAELAARFWRQAAARVGSHAVLAPDTITMLARYLWPGNVRELQNVLSAVAVRAPRRGVVGPSWLPTAVTGAQSVEPGNLGTLASARREFDERYVRTALARCGGQRGRAARALGVTRQGLAKLIDRLGIDPRSSPGQDPGLTGA